MGCNSTILIPSQKAMDYQDAGVPLKGSMAGITMDYGCDIVHPLSVEKDNNLTTLTLLDWGPVWRYGNICSTKIAGNGTDITAFQMGMTNVLIIYVSIDSHVVVDAF